MRIKVVVAITIAQVPRQTRARSGLSLACPHQTQFPRRNVTQRRSHRAPESPRPRPGRARCRGASLDRLRPRPCTPATVAVCAARVAFLCSMQSFCGRTMLGVPKSARAALSAKISAVSRKIRHPTFFDASSSVRIKYGEMRACDIAEIGLRRRCSGLVSGATEARDGHVRLANVAETAGARHSSTSACAG